MEKRRWQRGSRGRKARDEGHKMPHAVQTARRRRMVKGSRKWGGQRRKGAQSRNKSRGTHGKAVWGGVLREVKGVKGQINVRKDPEKTLELKNVKSLPKKSR